MPDQVVPTNWPDAGPGGAASYIEPHILKLAGPLKAGTRVLDVGCGNGYHAGRLSGKGCTVVGIDPSPTGVAIARATYPGSRFEVLAASSDMLGPLGEQPFDLVVCTEVVEHLYDPSSWATGCFAALRPGGRLVVTTPYHGWAKNIAIAVTGMSDIHHNSLEVGGHIKFFSRATLERLLKCAGFRDVRFSGAGRIPFLWRSMVISAGKPHRTV